MTYVRLTCSECGIGFDKPKNEYNRRIKNGIKEFHCGRSCGAKAANKTAPKTGYPTKIHHGSKRDEYTPFRWFARRISYRAKQRNYCTDITVQSLKELWDSQKGICPLTGWQLILPHNADYWQDESPFGIKSASVDRIDNTKGYIQGNVRFVAIIVNYARNIFSDKEVIEFAKAVVEHSQK
jgi:hypothetical protein